MTPMKRPAVAASIAIAALSVGVALVGCGSDSKSKSTTSSTTTSATSATKTSASSSAPSTSTQASGPNQTIGEYLKQNNIELKDVNPGDPGSPKVALGVPQGWAALQPSEEAPYGGITFEGAANPNDPPDVRMKMAKLTGNLDQQGLFAVAHGVIKNLPGFSETDPAQDSTLGGFPATQIGGTYTADGNKRAIYEKTVLIKGQNGTFLLQLIAESSDAERAKLQDAMAAIDQGTTITA